MAIKRERASVALLRRAEFLRRNLSDCFQWAANKEIEQRCRSLGSVPSNLYKLQLLELEELVGDVGGIYDRLWGISQLLMEPEIVGFAMSGMYDTYREMIGVSVQALERLRTTADLAGDQMQKRRFQMLRLDLLSHVQDAFEKVDLKKREEDEF